MSVEKILELYNQGEKFYAENDSNRAASAYVSALKLDTERKYSSMLHFRLGSILLLKGQEIEGIKEFRQSLDDAPMLNADEYARYQLVQMASSNLGVLLLNRIEAGDENYKLDEAEKCFRRVLEIPIDDPEIPTLRRNTEANLEYIKKLKQRGYVIYDKTGRIKNIFPSEKGD